MQSLGWKASISLKPDRTDEGCTSEWPLATARDGQTRRTAYGVPWGEFLRAGQSWPCLTQLQGHLSGETLMSLRLSEPGITVPNRAWRRLTHPKAHPGQVRRDEMQVSVSQNLRLVTSYSSLESIRAQGRSEGSSRQPGSRAGVTFHAQR